MKNKGLPDNSEWEKIINDAFSSDEEHVFSENYIRKKHDMQRSIIMKKKTPKKHLAVSFAAIAAVAVIIPTSVYAYNKITASIEKTANYQTTVKIPKSDGTEQLSEETGYKYYEFGYIPDGYYKSDQEKGNGKGFVNDEGSNFQGYFYKLPDNEDIDININFSDNYETYQNNGKTAMISYRVSYDEGNIKNFGRDVIISFDDTHYIMQMYLTDDISRDELINIIDGINLIDTEEMMYSTRIPFLEKETSDYNSPPVVEIDDEKTNIKTVGETIIYDFDEKHRGYMPVPHEDVVFMGDFDLTLNSYEFTDSFEGIHTDSCGWEYDFSEYMDENGNIRENIRSYINLGDGVNTIDETVAEESMPMHILKVNVTFKNTDPEKNGICICPNLLINENGSAYDFHEADFLNKYGTDSYNDSIWISDIGRHFSLDMGDAESEKNNVYLAPGESADVDIAFIVPDDVKDNLYLMFVRSGNGSSSQMLNEGQPAFSISE